MWIELFLCLLLAYLVADFGLQTSSSCKSKAQKHWRSVHQYIHAGIVFALSWLVTFDLRFWWAALIIGVLHFGSVAASARADRSCLAMDFNV